MENRRGSAYNGHFGCTCYHPLFLFNQFGDLERCSLRPGNVHSADGWRDILEPVVNRYKERKVRLYFRGDAALRRTSMSFWKPRAFSTSSASRRTPFFSALLI